MKGKGILIPLFSAFILLILTAGAFYYWNGNVNSVETQVATAPGAPLEDISLTPTLTAELTVEIPSNYEDAIWFESEEDEYIFTDETGLSVEILGNKSTGETGGENVSYFVDFYKSQLAEWDWIRTDYTSGASGESYTYTLKDNYITFGYEEKEPDLNSTNQEDIYSVFVIIAEKI